MQKLSIPKADLLRLAAIISKRHPANEELVIEEMPICWKIQTVHPISHQESLVAYIHKYNDHDNPVLAAYSRLRPGMGMDNSQVPTISRGINSLHPVRTADT